MESVEPDKIQLKAWFDEKARLHIVDQDDREFDFVPEHQARLGTKDDKAVQIKVDLEYPHWPFDKPHVEVTFRLPVEVRSKSLQRMIAEEQEF